MAEKKFFWLKLKEDFFYTETAIKKLRKIAGGDTYTVIYLKILLRSLKDSGKIFFEGIDDSFHEELALMIDEEPDNVLFTLTFLEKCGLLLKVNDFEYELTAIPCLTGSESESAPRVRKHREKQKTLQSNDGVTFCNTEIELDLELELNKELKTEKEINIEPPSASASAKIIKNVKQNRIFFENDPELNQEFQYFIDMRNTMKPKPTEHAIDLLIKELEKLSTDNGCFNRDVAIEIVKQSIKNSWKGLFPPKEQRNSSTPQKGKTAQELDSFYGMAKSWAERNRDEQ